MIIPGKINFTQLVHYGTHCEECFRQNFSKKFDWISYNLELSKRIFQDEDRKAIAIDPSYISKSGKCIPWVGYFWSGCARQVKHGLEIMGIGFIDIDKHSCMTLKAEQSPDNISLHGFGSTLNDWYLNVIEKYKEQLHDVSNYIVADAFFSKKLFAQGLEEMNFHLVSRLRDDANLMYLFFRT